MFWFVPNMLPVPKLGVEPKVFVANPVVPAGLAPNKLPVFVEVFWPNEKPPLVVVVILKGVLFWPKSPIL